MLLGVLHQVITSCPDFLKTFRFSRISLCICLNFIDKNIRFFFEKINMRESVCLINRFKSLKFDFLLFVMLSCTPSYLFALFLPWVYSDFYANVPIFPEDYFMLCLNQKFPFLINLLTIDW